MEGFCSVEDEIPLTEKVPFVEDKVCLFEGGSEVFSAEDEVSTFEDENKVVCPAEEEAQLSGDVTGAVCLAWDLWDLTVD